MYLEGEHPEGDRQRLVRPPVVGQRRALQAVAKAALAVEQHRDAPELADEELI